jgi:Ca2+-binding EF-hand superfamily protein
MGNKSTYEIPIVDLKRFEKQTYFSRYEINELFQIYTKMLFSERITNTNTATVTDKESTAQTPTKPIIDSAKLSRMVIEPATILTEFAPLKNNPFGDKIVDLFASDEDGGLKFEDFLDMCSVFSTHAPLHLKLRVAFFVFDKDNDGRLDKEDIDYVISRMVDDHMVSDQDHPQSIQKAREKLFVEADIDRSGQITLKEFEKLVDRMPDFESKFAFHLESLFNS